MTSTDDDMRREERVAALLRRLPAGVQSAAAWLRAPHRWWVRLPAGLLLMAGSVLFILPVFGLWMLPAGLLLLSEDIAPIRRASARLLAWMDHRWPSLFRPPARPGMLKP